jgi:hypothetical protein
MNAPHQGDMMERGILYREIDGGKGVELLGISKEAVQAALSFAEASLEQREHLRTLATLSRTRDADSVVSPAIVEQAKKSSQSLVAGAASKAREWLVVYEQETGR